MALAIDYLSGGMTPEEYEALPEDGTRRELIDGVLHVTPTPSIPHQTFAGLLMTQLALSAPEEYLVTQAVEIKLKETLRYVPDLLVVTADVMDAARPPCRVAPSQVILAAEIVSPSTTSMDRITKPAQYAQAGIPWFWRIETRPTLRVTAHQISANGGVYELAGEFSTRIKLEDPWPMDIDLQPLARMAHLMT
ncbi:Uma2 family endonuclease [Longispora albida]|uniref:Uma2 family endonuclease n=1 Tax=Longispora albida TaxID=203523 RepID=UPI0003773139|nr:Uma2 family endonuclease [Longispora albida]